MYPIQLITQAYLCPHLSTIIQQNPHIIRLSIYTIVFLFNVFKVYINISCFVVSVLEKSYSLHLVMYLFIVITNYIVNEIRWVRLG